LREERRLRALMQFTKSEALVKPGIEQDRDDDNLTSPAGIGPRPGDNQEVRKPLSQSKTKTKVVPSMGRLVESIDIKDERFWA